MMGAGGDRRCLAAFTGAVALFCSVVLAVTSLVYAGDCRSRDDMRAVADAYIDNVTYLNDFNIDGECDGRGKPRYLDGEKWYDSVPYAWGGWDTPDEFDAFMEDGKQAGDIDTAADEECSRGVDCSGFVSQVWELDRHYRTDELVGLSCEIKREQLVFGDIIIKSGCHVVLFDKVENDQVVVYESVTAVVIGEETYVFDRVIHQAWPWSRFKDYQYRRYKNVCGMLDNCGTRAGNVDVGPGGGGVPADAITIDGWEGDACRELVVVAGSVTTLAIDAAPSLGKSHYAIWIYGGEIGCPGETVIDLLTNQGYYYILGTPGASGVGNQGGGARCLPINNLANSGSCPCDVTFPVGRTSRSFGGGTAGALCLNRKPGYPKAPTTFSQTFPPGDFMVGAIIQDNNAYNSPWKNMSVTNWIVVHAW